MRRDSVATKEARRLFELTEQLIQDRPLLSLLDLVVDAVRAMRGIEGVAILISEDGELRLAAVRGELTPGDIESVATRPGRVVQVGLTSANAGPDRTLALVAAGTPVGLLVLRGSPLSPVEREALEAFVAYAALAIERSQLRAVAVQSAARLRADQMRTTLLAATAHDLRGPLATMKAITSSLAVVEDPSPASVHVDLCTLLDSEVDHMTRLVAGLLDVARVEAGALVVQSEERSLPELLDEVVKLSSAGTADGRVLLDLPDELPAVAIDPLLVTQVVMNLLDNADRYGPPGTPIRVAVRRRDDVLEVSVADQGGGTLESDDAGIFDPFVQSGHGGRAGLGLAIAKSFVEAHHQRIWVENSQPGARFVFTLPIAGLADIDGPRPACTEEIGVLT